nr:aquaporin [Aeromonas veronii]
MGPSRVLFGVISNGRNNVKPVAAEFMGTFWLVLGGCGSAVLAAAFPHVGIGLLGVSLAFGLTVLTMAFAIGHISGCHLNPAVTVGLWAGGRFPASGVLPYIVAQVLGGIAAAAVLYVIASGQAGFDLSAGFAPIAIGLCLTLIHLVSIPVTNTSVNPARSTGVALFVGDWAISQLWLFWVAPIVGAILGALAYRLVATEQK